MRPTNRRLGNTSDRYNNVRNVVNYAIPYEDYEQFENDSSDIDMNCTMLNFKKDEKSGGYIVEMYNEKGVIQKTKMKGRIKNV